jgi:phosphoglycolate phosphatase-like HAD superfamily hydrolase
VLLFDIDGTLVSTGGAGRRAMVGAFAQVYERRDVFDNISFAGMTDRAIVRHGLRNLSPDGDNATERAIDRLLEVYLALLKEELAEADQYRVLPGVTALLRRLRESSAEPHAIGLGTGNVRRGAYAKLERGAIHDAFAFGGFGCDAEDRAELLRAGARRGADLVGARLEDCRVVVVGDTPKDVSAALGIGARCVAVGTGSYRHTDLVQCGAHAAFATLAEDGVYGALFSDGETPM